jgi:molybdate transport system regulatory protein
VRLQTQPQTTDISFHRRYLRRMEESIRNQLPGTVKSIVSDKVISEVIVETSIGEIASIITTRSVKEMTLMPGDKVFALVKATNVSLRRA